MSAVDLHGFLTYLIGCQIVTTEDLFASQASGQLGRGIWLYLLSMGQNTLLVGRSEAGRGGKIIDSSDIQNFNMKMELNSRANLAFKNVNSKRSFSFLDTFMFLFSCIQWIQTVHSLSWTLSYFIFYLSYQIPNIKQKTEARNWKTLGFTVFVNVESQRA